MCLITDYCLIDMSEKMDDVAAAVRCLNANCTDTTVKLPRSGSTVQPGPELNFNFA